MVHTVGDVVARYVAERPQPDLREDWLSSVIETLGVIVTGELQFFNVRREPWSDDEQTVLALDVVASEGCNREVYALAERAMLACCLSMTDGEDEVRAAVMAGRTAFLRARLSNAIYWAEETLPDELDGPEAVTAVEEWKELAYPVQLDNADRLALLPLHVPRFMLPQGNYHAILSSHRAQVNAMFDSDSRVERRTSEAFIRRCLAGAALAWLDGAMRNPEPERALSLVAAAGAALEFAAGAARPGRELAAEAGKKGSDKRHARTRALKAWAIREASFVRGHDMTVARALARRIPADLSDASADPVRLIYESIREARRRRFETRA